VAVHVVSDRRWRFDVEPAVLWDTIDTTADFRTWWPWLRRFDGHGLVAGDVWTAVVQPPLPYSLRFTITLDEVHPPSTVTATIAGEIEGTARLEISPADGGGCEARLVSYLAPSHPWLRTAARLARPVVAFGHDWVLDTGAKQFARRGLVGREIRP
jgi:hypothetical protein